MRERMAMPVQSARNRVAPGSERYPRCSHDAVTERQRGTNGVVFLDGAKGSIKGNTFTGNLLYIRPASPGGGRGRRW